MASSSDALIYLGAPLTDYAPTPADDADAYVSKIGGVPAWLRPVIPSVEGNNKALLNQCARCPKCRSAANLRLLTQIHSPLEVYDRVLYLFMCAACSTPQESIVCSFRSQLYNPSYDTERGKEAQPAKAAAAAGAANEVLFTVDDDDGWGDEEDAAPAPVVEAVAVPKVSTPIVYPSASSSDIAGYAAAMTRAPLPMLVLDTFLEPAGEKEKNSNKSIAEQVAEVEAMFPGITDVSAEACEADKLPTGGACGPNKGGGGPIVIEDDDGPTETADEKASAEFFARLARCPTQCIRWSPKGFPLLSSATRKPPANIPCCSSCGAPRVFEFQLLSPAVYYFERLAKKSSQRAKKTPEAGSKAAKKETIAAVEGSADEPHFSTISVFTCSKHCYDADHTVTLEYAHTEPEL